MSRVKVIFINGFGLLCALGILYDLLTRLFLHHFQDMWLWVDVGYFVAVPTVYLLCQSRRRARSVCSVAKAIPGQGSFDKAVQHYNQAMALMNQRKPKAAITEFRTCLRVHPNTQNVHLNLGIALYSIGQLKAAITEFQEELHLNPNSVAAYRELGRTLIISKHFEEASATLWKGIQLDPARSELHLLLGVACLNAHNYNDAKAAYQEAIRLDPNDAIAHTHLGHVFQIMYLQTPNPLYLERGIMAYQEALRLNPHMRRAHRGYSVLLWEAGQTWQAFRHWGMSFR